MSKLKTKIREVEENHAEENLNNHLEKHDQEKYVRSLLLLGGIRAADRITRSISSQVVNALITFQQENMHEQLGYSKFAVFLDQSEYSPMSKNDFYRRKELLEAEGAEKYDLFNEAKIPMATRKLIAQTTGADIIIEGDEILIGDERADISNLPLIKTLIKSLAEANEKFHAGREKQDEQIKSLKGEINQGREQYEELERAMDAANSGTPYEIALTKAVGGLINLAIVAKKSPIVEKDARGRDDIETLWKQMLIVRTALLQDDFVFAAQEGDFTLTEIRNNTNKKPTLSRAAKVLAADDDFGDDDEQ